MKRHRWSIAPALAAAIAFAAVLCATGQQMVQHGFETRDPLWVKGSADAAFKESAHRLTDQAAHSGRRSEFIQLQVEQGTFIHYTYDVGRAPVVEELTAAIWVKCNRPGPQLLCRIVLPHEKDPAEPSQPLTALVPAGDAYQFTGRWERLALRQPLKRLREQQQLLRGRLKRDIDVTDAYVDRIVLNLYSGPGLTEAYIDDLEVGPVLEAPRPTAAAEGQVPGRPAVNRRTSEVRLDGKQLLVSGKKFFPRIIRHTGTPLSVLYETGFNTVLLDESTPPGLVADAANLGFWIMPSVTAPPLLEGRGTPAQLTSANETFTRTVARFLNENAVLSWDLGANLEYERVRAVKSTAQQFRQADPMRPVSADVWDGFRAYSDVDSLMLGAHRWPLLTGMELTNYRDWLMQRRQLCPSNTFCWTWIQTHLPDWFIPLAYGRAGPRPGVDGDALGPQAEQVRLLAYTAIGSGYRGLGFWSDRYLADSHTGRDRLLGMAGLNQELQMLEPLLVTGGEPQWVDTSRGEVKAAVIRCDKAMLVLPVWIGGGAQFVPGQSAVRELTIKVPGVPQGTWPYEVSPGLVRSLEWKRVHGGCEVKLKEFGLTSAIVFTGDLGPTGLVVRFQEQQRALAPLAAQYAHDQAQEELTKVAKVNAALEQAGHKLDDGEQLLESARRFLASCQESRRNGAHAAAYADAQRALRPLRILMRAHWEAAVKPFDAPVSSPYAVSFFTLPRHWDFVTEIARLRPDLNQLTDGDFELPPTKTPQQESRPNWLLEEVPSLDNVTVSAKRILAKDAPQGRQCLQLEIAPKDPLAPPVVLERTFVAIHSPAVRLPPGTLVKISTWIKLPVSPKASTDGALFYDSAGGEPLAVRLTNPTGWKQFTLYREVPDTGRINVTLAMTGIGAVYFDDVKIEPLIAKGAPATPAPVPPSGAIASNATK